MEARRSYFEDLEALRQERDAIRGWAWEARVLLRGLEATLQPGGTTSRSRVVYRARIQELVNRYPES